MIMTDCDSKRLTEAILALVCELRASRKDGQIRDELKKGLLALEKQIARLENKFMSAISDLTDKFNARFDQIGTSVDEIVASQTAIAADVTFLKETILKLQQNPGPISPEDQALLDALETRVNGLATKVAAASQALKDLDAQTEQPPTP